mmetsp:Transcript_15762/g.23152  ORF Transcript_15762/g.23152 Transcript_15762/m.23152 type:complete len:667 (+) Transcript_15762:33-2033(+)
MQRWLAAAMVCAALVMSHTSSVPLPAKFPPGSPVENSPAPPTCGSCFGAEDAAKGIKCCTSCADVQRAYKEKSWAWPGNNNVEACKGEPEAATALAPVSPQSVSAQRNPDVPCGSHLSCDNCRANACAWCIASRRCVEDKPWMCTGEDDHIGNIGTVKSCPTRAEVNSKRVARREEEDKARAERKVMSEEDQELCRKRAEDKLSAKQQEELQRLRTEDSSTDSASGGPTEANHAEIRRRAAAVGQAQTDPYGVLELDAEAQMTAIRKAYRRLSLQLHPDKIKDTELKALAQTAFMDLVAAYEVLGDPEKRAAYDNMGGQDQAQFNTFWEWEQYGKGENSAHDFYNGNKLISKLTEKLWPRRVVGDAIWLVEFYAPWCSACGTFVEPYKAVAKKLEEDHIEVGAVNCAKEKTLCSEHFAVTSYPMIMMVGSAERGTQQIYSQKESKTADSLVTWARQVAEEWTWLYASAVLEPLNTDAAFDQVVLSSKMLWFVVFTDGVYCGQCRTAMTNALRLSAGVAGMAKVGVVNCEEDSAQALCYERARLPAPPHAPEVRIFKSGAKHAAAAPGYMGEVLYNPNDIQPHVALRLAELVARNALNHELPPSSVASSGGKGEYDSGATGDEDKQPPPPRRPEPMWNGPDAESLPKGIAWGGGGGGAGHRNMIGGR